MEDKVYGNDVNELVKEATEMFEPGCSILDIGCGRGKESIALAKSGFDVTSVDKLDKFIKDLEELAKKERLKMKPMKVDVENLNDFSKLGNYDVIISMNLLQLLHKNYLDHLIFWIQSHTNLGGYNVIKTFTDIKYKKNDGTICIIPIRKNNEFDLRGRYWNWSKGYYHEDWGNWESHKGKPEEHTHYLLELIARNVRPLQLGYCESKKLEMGHA